MSFWHFLQYNNAIPIAISVVLLGAGGAFAATDPGAIYSAQQQVVSVDNTYLVNKDLSAYSPRVEITNVTEDTDMYYVAYNFYTIDLQDGVWRDVAKQDTLKVSKTDLGQYRDLGVYVTEQLKQRTDRELAYLQDVQGIERKNVTHKVVATQYGGLVGKFLDTSTEELPGYTPVVTPPPPVQVAAAGATQQDTAQQNTTSVSSGNPTLSMQILGNSPAQIPQRSSYLDLGVVASDGNNSVIRIETYLDGVKVAQVNIDTAATSTHTIRYVALDPQNNSLTGERTVIVYDSATGEPVPQSGVKSGVMVGAPITPVAAPAPVTAPNTGTDNSIVPTSQSATTTASAADQGTSTSASTSTSTSIATTSTRVQSDANITSSTSSASSSSQTTDSSTATITSQGVSTSTPVDVSPATTTTPTPVTDTTPASTTSPSLSASSTTQTQ